MVVADKVAPPESMTKLGSIKVKDKLIQLSDTDSVKSILYEVALTCLAVQVY